MYSSPRCTDADFFRHFNNVFVVKKSHSSKKREALRRQANDSVGQQPAAPAVQWQKGDNVEYHSLSMQQWIPAVIAAVDGDRVMTNVKRAWLDPGQQARLLRRPQ